MGDKMLGGDISGVYPVDQKDKHCFEFTRCNRCTTMDFGEACNPDQIDYNVSLPFYYKKIILSILYTVYYILCIQFEITADGEVICKDPEGTCQNAICQCDKGAILGFKEFIDIYDPSYHAFLGFEAITECEIKPKNPSIAKPKMACCGEYPNRTVH